MFQILSSIFQIIKCIFCEHLSEIHVGNIFYLIRIYRITNISIILQVGMNE
jgi:hypothetical protein